MEKEHQPIFSKIERWAFDVLSHTKEILEKANIVPETPWHLLGSLAERRVRRVLATTKIVSAFMAAIFLAPRGLFRDLREKKIGFVLFKSFLLLVFILPLLILVIFWALVLLIVLLSFIINNLTALF